MLCGTATANVFASNDSVFSMEVGKASVMGHILDFKLFTNLNTKADSAELTNRLIAFEGICEAKNMSSGTKTLCLNHHKALATEATLLRQFFDSIPEAREKRWVGPTIAAATVLTTFASTMYLSARDAQRERELKELQTQTVKISQLLFKFEVTEVKEINKQLDQMLKIQLEKQIETMIVDLALKTQQFIENMHLQYSTPSELPLKEFLQS